MAARTQLVIARSAAYPHLPLQQLVDMRQRGSGADRRAGIELGRYWGRLADLEKRTGGLFDARGLDILVRDADDHRRVQLDGTLLTRRQLRERDYLAPIGMTADPPEGATGQRLRRRADSTLLIGGTYLGLRATYTSGEADRRTRELLNIRSNGASYVREQARVVRSLVAQ